MKSRRLWIDAPLLVNTTVEMPADRSHYARNVLRLKPGDPVVIFDGLGVEIQGRIQQLERKQSTVRLEKSLPSTPESSLEIILVQGISRGERMDHTIQKATELGVKRIVPLVTGRSGVRLDEDRRSRRMDHWRGVAVSACEQCGRSFLPEIGDVSTLPELLKNSDTALRLVLDGRAEKGMRGRLRPDGPVIVCVGPEGGFQPTELEQMIAGGFDGLRLGPRVMRTETAGPAAIAALQSFWGDMG